MVRALAFHQCGLGSISALGVIRGLSLLVQEADRLLDGKHGAKGMIIFSPDLNRVEQATIAKLPNFRGAFLAVGDAYDDCEVNIFGTMKLQGTQLILTNRLQTFGIRFMTILHLI